MKEMRYIKEDNPVNRFLNMFEDDLKFKHWYSGHFHDDINMGKHTLLYNKIIEIK